MLQTLRGSRRIEVLLFFGALSLLTSYSLIE